LGVWDFCVQFGGVQFGGLKGGGSVCWFEVEDVCLYEVGFEGAFWGLGLLVVFAIALGGLQIGSNIGLSWCFSIFVDGEIVLGRILGEKGKGFDQPGGVEVAVDETGVEDGGVDVLAVETEGVVAGF